MNAQQLQALTRALALAAAAMGSALPAQAAFVVYTDPALFQAAAGTSAGVDGFDDLVAGAALAGPLNRSVGDIDYRARAVASVSDLGAEDFFPVAPGGDNALSPNFADASVVLDLFSQPLRGLGGQFFASNENGDVAGGELTLLLVDGDGSFSYTWSAGSTPGFLGFVSTSSIASLTLSATQPQGGFSYAALDRLTLTGVPTVATVPEPGMLPLALLGLAATGLASRRRERR